MYLKQISAVNLTDSLAIDLFLIILSLIMPS